MSSLRRAASSTDSESESDSEEGTERENRKQEQEQELEHVSDSEADPGNHLEEEEAKSNGKQQKLQRRQRQRQDEEEVADEVESESERGEDPKPEPVPLPRSKKGKKETKARGPVKVPLVAHNISGKRGRDADGTNGSKGGAPTLEPEGKKSKQPAGKDDKARSLAETSPAKSPSRKEKKGEQTMRGSIKATGAGAMKPEKVSQTVVALAAAKSDNPKAQGAGRKRKASTPPPGAVSVRHQQAQKVEGEKSPTKSRKPFSWSSAVEESLVNQLHEDFLNGVAIPATKVDPYWEKLLKRLPLDADSTLSGLQLCEKVRRMRQRYYTLKDRSRDDGAKLFKSPHEERIYQLWTEIWDSGTKMSQPTVEGEPSEDESAETAATTAPRESSRRSLRQSNAHVIKDPATHSDWEVSVGTQTQGKGGDSISDDENEEEIELTQREMAGKVLPEAAVSTPFISKPRLEYTPLAIKEGKSNAARRVDEVTSVDQFAEEVMAKDDGGKIEVVSSADEQHKEEIIRFAQGVRSFTEECIGNSRGTFGNVMLTGSAFVSGVLEGAGAGSGSPAARELRKRWRELKVQEIALLSQRLQLMQEHCRLQEEELKMQIQRADE